jgi:hypothetical protein
MNVSMYMYICICISKGGSKVNSEPKGDKKVILCTLCCAGVFMRIHICMHTYMYLCAYEFIYTYLYVSM